MTYSARRFDLHAPMSVGCGRLDLFSSMMEVSEFVLSATIQYVHGTMNEEDQQPDMSIELPLRAERASQKWLHAA
jgi:hypothetical protein